MARRRSVRRQHHVRLRRRGGVDRRGSANSDRPGVLSQGTYGAKVGIPLVLESWRATVVHATFFVPGPSCRTTSPAGWRTSWPGVTSGAPRVHAPLPGAVVRVRGRGRTRSGAGRFCEGFGADGERLPLTVMGLQPRHHRPAGRKGFEYSSNSWTTSGRIAIEGTSLIELPVHWMLDDAPHFWFAGRAGRRRSRRPREVPRSGRRNLTAFASFAGTTCSPASTVHRAAVPARQLLDRLLTDISAAGERASRQPATSRGWSRDRRLPPLRHRDRCGARARTQRRGSVCWPRTGCVVAADVSDDVGEYFGAGAFDGRVRAAIADIALPDTAEGLVRTAMASYGRLDAVSTTPGSADQVAIWIRCRWRRGAHTRRESAWARAILQARPSPT